MSTPAQLQRKQINAILDVLEALSESIRDIKMSKSDRVRVHNTIEKLRELVVVGDSATTPLNTSKRAVGLRTSAANWRRIANTRPLRKTVTGEICLQLAVLCEAVAEIV